MADLFLGITGYPVTCCSKEALESFNNGVMCYVSSNGNCALHFTKAIELDPDFLLPHCVMGMFWLDSLKPPHHPQVALHIEAVKRSVAKRGFNKREEAFIQALQKFASGDMLQCTDALIQSIMNYPLDMLALRFVAGNAITLGTYERARDTMAWALAFWEEGMELYSYVLSFYAFALEETNEKQKAEKLLKKALDMNPVNPWAHHAMAHVLEESHDANDGVKFLSNTRADWKDSFFGGHLIWHLCLNYFDKGDVDLLFHEYDNCLSKNVTADNLFGILDASSLLWRLEVTGVEVGEERWSKITNAIAEHTHVHRSPWFDTHIMMTLAHGKVTQDAARLAIADGMLKSMKEYSQTESVINGSISGKLCLPVCTALLAYGQEKYDDVLQIMLPLRYDFIRFGGSWAQRQVFIITLIQASFKAKKAGLTKGLIGELRGQKPMSRKIVRWLKELEEQK